MIGVLIGGVRHLVNDDSDVKGPPLNTLCGVTVADPLSIGTFYGGQRHGGERRNVPSSSCSDCDRIRELRKQTAARTTRAMGLGRAKRRK